MKHSIRSRFASAAFLLLATLISAAAPAASANPFFAMDTALRDGKLNSADDQAALLKELGYAGIGTTGYISDDALAAFERRGLKVFNTYLTLDFDASKPEVDPKLKDLIARLKGRDTALWLAIGKVSRDGAPLKPSDPAGDEVVVPRLVELADLARTSGIRIALYPHTGFWVERVDDALRLVGKVKQANVGATFNLCHWLKVEGDLDPRPVLKAALPHLFFVTVNGADRGDTRTMNWDRLIRPLGQGCYEVGGLLGILKELDYLGPVGFQGYGIQGDSRQILTQTMAAWQELGKPPAPEHSK
ncbi:MAG: sugar phosphate isomerase/epimerase [Akkermansiaceae bacterium]|jgi:sugar phosphate isomerase/epimerase|nr:sugar phosphate isomerase/epimerase [Akkermansiaceae bacterium]